VLNNALCEACKQTLQDVHPEQSPSCTANAIAMAPPPHSRKGKTENADGHTGRMYHNSIPGMPLVMVHPMACDAVSDAVSDAGKNGVSASIA